MIRSRFDFQKRLKISPSSEHPCYKFSKSWLKKLTNKSYKCFTLHDCNIAHSYPFCHCNLFLNISFSIFHDDFRNKIDSNKNSRVNSRKNKLNELWGDFKSADSIINFRSMKMSIVIYLLEARQCASLGFEPRLLTFTRKSYRFH